MKKQVFNVHFLENWREVDPIRWRFIVNDILETFFSSTGNSYRQLTAAREAGDWDSIRALAHSMKSSYGHVGAEEAHRILKAIESLVRAGKYRRAEVFLKEFDAVYLETRLLALSFQRANLQAA